MKKMSVCVITCYKQPDYVRAKTLRAAIASIPEIDLLVIKNKHTGLIRYLEVLVKTIKYRFKYNPDVYLLTFRGYEILPLIRVATVGKKLIFDEFINLIEWVGYEHKILKAEGVVIRSLRPIYKLMLMSTDMIITDTQSHAKLSSDLMGIPINNYKYILVGTDESVTKIPQHTKKNNEKFTVLYYGSMLPLHGIDYVTEAALLLKENRKIEFLLVGGGQKIQERIKKATLKGANITYKKWIPFKALSQAIIEADLCLAGPFGNTIQSQYVITGKTYHFLYLSRPVIIGANLESHIFTDKKDALIVKQASSKGIADAIIWAYDNQKELSHIGKAGFRLYQKSLSIETLTRQIKKLLFELHPKS